MNLIYNQRVEQKDDKNPEKGKVFGKAELITFATDLGISIALPLCILAYIGKTLDNKFDSFPIIFLSSIFFSFLTTTVVIYFKIKKYLKK